MMDEDELVTSGRFAEAVRRLSKADGTSGTVDAVADILLDRPTMGADVLHVTVDLFKAPASPSSLRIALTPAHPDYIDGASQQRCALRRRCVSTARATGRKARSRHDAKNALDALQNDSGHDKYFIKQVLPALHRWLVHPSLATPPSMSPSPAMVSCHGAEVFGAPSCPGPHAEPAK